MSSDSELDEFFDAEDATPIKHVSPEEESAVELEARRLLEEKRLNDERRKIEDEAIERRLAELQRKKEEEKEKEAERKALELGNKRKKLDSLRRLMVDESTPASTPERKGESNQEQYQGDVIQLETDLPENVTIDTQSDVKNADNVESMPYCIEPNNTDASSCVETNIPNSNLTPTSETENDLNGSCKAEGTESSNHSDNIGTASSSQVDDNLNLAPDKTVLPDKDILAITTENISDIVHSTQLEGNEPDIVKSTKLNRPSPPPETSLLTPVAPPRRKRKNKSSALTNSSEFSGSSESLTPIPNDCSTPVGLPPSTTPAATVESLTKGLEHSLDLKSATQGDRVVNTEDMDLDSAKVHDSANVSSDMDTTVTNTVTPPPKPPRLHVSTKGGTPQEPQDVFLSPGDFRDKRGTEDDDKSPFMRPRSNSGRFLTDEEILESVIVKNLDTGDCIPLSLAEDKLPKTVNPLALHIMRRTQEYASDTSLHKDGDSEDEVDGKQQSATLPAGTAAVRKTGTRLKKFLGKTVTKIKAAASSTHDDTSSDEEESVEGRKFLRIKSSGSNKGPYDFDQLQHVQDLSGTHEGAVWIMKFSHCGRLLASGGQDNILRVWVLKEAYGYFDEMRQKYSETKLSPAISSESLSSQVSAASEVSDQEGEETDTPFMKKPFCTYMGHSADVLDVSWSKNLFILSSSMDKTVRLWHISRKECLCCFQHIDFVTAIVFHPRDDRYFLSGSLDGKLRLWNIPDKKVALWNEVQGATKLITAANFCQNGKFAVVGTYDGRCIFYNTDQLKYFTQIHVRSTRGKNAKGRKISGIEPMPGEDKVLVTSNDSRLRLYDLRDLTLTCKYKGCANNSSQIRAGFSYNGKYIVCGSEDRFVYIWKAHHEFHKFSSARRDRNDFWEAVKAHDAVVTAAIFAPNPSMFLPAEEKTDKSIPEDSQTSEKNQTTKTTDSTGVKKLGSPAEVLISADFTGAIKVFVNKFKNAC